MTKAFIRRVGFGLRPDEDMPEDPLNWAKSQMNVSPKLIWPGKLYSETEMIDIRVDFQLEEDKCFGAGQDGLTDATTIYESGMTAKGISLTGTADVAGCAIKDHTKATVSSFHLGGALTWTF